MAVLEAIQVRCDRIVRSETFEGFIVTILVVDFVILCLESWIASSDSLVKLALDLILLVLILDAVLRLGATIRDVQRYFADFWNCLDLLIIVGLIYLPDDFFYLVLLRLPRFWRSSRVLRGLGFVKLVLFNFRRSLLRLFVYCWSWFR